VVECRIKESLGGSHECARSHLAIPLTRMAIDKRDVEWLQVSTLQGEIDAISLRVGVVDIKPLTALEGLGKNYARMSLMILFLVTPTQMCRSMPACPCDTP